MGICEISSPDGPATTTSVPATTTEVAVVPMKSPVTAVCDIEH